MGEVRKSFVEGGGGVQLFASAWDVGLVGADRSKLERKKICIILCPVYLRIVLNTLYSVLTILHLSLQFFRLLHKMYITISMLSRRAT